MEGQSESDSEDDSIESTDLQKDHFVDVEVHDRDEASQKWWGGSEETAHTWLSGGGGESLLLLVG